MGDHVGPRECGFLLTVSACAKRGCVCMSVSVGVTTLILCLCKCVYGRLYNSPQRYQLLVPGTCECSLRCQKGLCRCG